MSGWYPLEIPDILTEVFHSTSRQILWQ